MFLGKSADWHCRIKISELTSQRKALIRAELSRKPSGFVLLFECYTGHFLLTWIHSLLWHFSISFYPLSPGVPYKSLEVFQRIWWQTLIFLFFFTKTFLNIARFLKFFWLNCDCWTLAKGDKMMCYYFSLLFALWDWYSISISWCTETWMTYHPETLNRIFWNFKYIC